MCVFSSPMPPPSTSWRPSTSSLRVTSSRSLYRLMRSRTRARSLCARPQACLRVSQSSSASAVPGRAASRCRSPWQTSPAALRCPPSEYLSRKKELATHLTNCGYRELPGAPRHPAGKRTRRRAARRMQTGLCGRSSVDGAPFGRPSGALQSSAAYPSELHGALGGRDQTFD